MSNKKELEAILKSVNKAVDSDNATLLKTGDDKANIKAITTGSIAIDNAIGIGGYPIGRIIEVYGPEASGKTTLTLNCIAAAQQRGEVCAFIDAEHALDPELAKGCGIVWEDLLFVQPTHGEQALSFAEHLIKTKKVSVVVVDSVAALVPKAELDGEMEDQQMGAQARMMGKGVRKLVAAINESHCVLIFINQIREKLGVMFGSPETTPGGKALKFASSIRLEARRIESITENKDIIGNRLRVKVVKNKVAPPHKKAEIDLIFGKGVDNTKDIIGIGVQYEIVTKKGSGHFSYKEAKGNGMNNFITSLKECGLIDVVEEEIRDAMTSTVVPAIPEEDNDDDVGFDEDQN